MDAQDLSIKGWGMSADLAQVADEMVESAHAVDGHRQFQLRRVYIQQPR